MFRVVYRFDSKPMNEQTEVRSMFEGCEVNIMPGEGHELLV